MKSDEFDILYVLEKNGWSSCFLYLGSEEPYSMVPTHIFNDPIEELLNALILMLQGSTEAKFSWYEEPGEYEWKITRNKEQHHLVEVEILEYSDFDKTANRRLFKTTRFNVKLKIFCICVMSQMAKIRSLMNEKSYKEARSFPHQVFKEYGKAFNNKYS